MQLLHGDSYAQIYAASLFPVSEIEITTDASNMHISWGHLRGEKRGQEKEPNLACIASEGWNEERTMEGEDNGCRTPKLKSEFGRGIINIAAIIFVLSLVPVVQTAIISVNAWTYTPLTCILSTCASTVPESESETLQIANDFLVIGITTQIRRDVTILFGYVHNWNPCAVSSFWDAPRVNERNHEKNVFYSFFYVPRHSYGTPQGDGEWGSQ